MVDEEGWITDPEILKRLMDMLKIAEEYVKVVREFRRRYFIITDVLEAAA